MKKTIQQNFMLICLLGISLSGKSQIIFQQNLNSQALGTYTLDEVKADFNTTSANGFIRKGKGEDRVSIVNTGKASPSGKCMKVKYPKGKHDTKDSGANWETNLGANYQELYLSYYVKFDANFDLLTKIGKLPGLGGGLNFSDGDDTNTHFHGKLMWRHDGQIQFYLKQPTNNDKEFFWGVEGGAGPRLKKNVWQHIQIRYKLNTVTNGAANKNGIMQAWLNGVQVANYTNIEFRKNSNVGINSMVFSTFFGGNEVDNPTQDVYAFFDDFKVSTSKITYVAPSARIANKDNLLVDNSTNEILLYPNPATNNFITISGINKEKSEITIYNELGNEVRSLFIDENNSQIDISRLSTGFYILRISDSTGERFKKFSKQ